MAVTGMVMGVSTAAVARAETLVIPPRPGQVGIGVQGQYGTLLNTGTFGELYSSGPGLTVRIRYRMRYERAIGLSFESERFDARVTPAAGSQDPKSSSFFDAGIEVYQLYNTRTKTTRMLNLGVGIAKATVKLADGETAFLTNGDGAYLSAGAGVERFFWQSWAVDFSTRYKAVFIDSKVNHDLQASLGLIVYASY